MRTIVDGENAVPEGPLLVMLKEQTARFVGQEIVRAESTVIDATRLAHQPVLALRTWGKHFLIRLPHMAIRVHFLLFGSWMIDEKRETPAKLSLYVADGSHIHFYACSVREIDHDLDAAYDWGADVMSDDWDAPKARKALRARPDMLACDALLDQDIFSGSGNIMKNEVLFRLRIHPLSTVGALPPAKLRALVDETRRYAFEFLAWKKAGTFKQHWLAHQQATCPRCHIPFHKANLGRTQRRAFWCERCQKRYG